METYFRCTDTDADADTDTDRLNHSIRHQYMHARRQRDLTCRHSAVLPVRVSNYNLNIKYFATQIPILTPKIPKNKNKKQKQNKTKQNKTKQKTKQTNIKHSAHKHTRTGTKAKDGTSLLDFIAGMLVQNIQVGVREMR